MLAAIAAGFWVFIGKYIECTNKRWIEQPMSGISGYITKKDEDGERPADFELFD
jgi:hypothetical protein